MTRKSSGVFFLRVNEFDSAALQHDLDQLVKWEQKNGSYI